MTIANRRRTSARLFALWKEIAKEDLLIKPETSDKAIGSPELTVGQALSLWVEYKITPDVEDPERNQAEYMLQAIEAILQQERHLVQWCGESVRIGLTEATPKTRPQAVKRLLPPAIRLMSVVRYNLEVLLAVLYAAQSTQIDPRKEPDEWDDLHNLLKEVETLRGATRPIENRLGSIFRVPDPITEPQFPLLN